MGLIGGIYDFDLTDKEEILISNIDKERKNKRNSKMKINKIPIKIIFILVFFICFIFLNFKFNIISQAILIINPILIQSLEIEIETNEIELGESTKIISKIFPEDYSKSELIWNISDNDIIEIQDDKVIGKKVGKATIYLSDGDTKSNEIEIEVLVSAKEVVIDNLISELKLEEEYILNTTVLPEDATYKNLSFVSNNPEILQIDDTGKIAAKSIGNSQIDIKDYKGNILKSFSIDVKKIPVEQIVIDDTKVTLGKGQKYILSATVSPSNATFKDIEWKSSNESIIKIQNREISAVGVGEATISAITDEGDKVATCSFTINANNPSNTKKYAKSRYNIRSGPSTDYKVLATTNEYEEIEFLQDMKEGWKKVRNSKGIVGYTYVKDGYYLNEKPKPVEEKLPENDKESAHISNVPYLNQFSLCYPTGCEAVSATMVLKYKGYNVSARNIVDNTKKGSKKYQSNDGKWYGANPFEAFVGSPDMGLAKGSYGVFAEPIVSSMKVYAGDKVKNISGCSESDLFSYVSSGKPVVVWCVKNAGDLKTGVTWNYEDGNGSFAELVGEHCAVLIGYDENYVYLNDPSAGANVKQSRSKFISNWKKLYSQAIIVE